jgi:hypothetical protein
VVFTERCLPFSAGGTWTAACVIPGEERASLRTRTLLLLRLNGKSEVAAAEKGAEARNATRLAGFLEET